MKPIYYCIIILSFILINCKDDASNLFPLKNRTVLVYLAANNNLSDEAKINIEQMESNIGDIDGNLLVYAKLPNNKPLLYQIFNENGWGKKKILNEYENLNSSNPLVLGKVISDVK